jgi:hypothetical protein
MGCSQKPQACSRGVRRDVCRGTSGSSRVTVAAGLSPTRLSSHRPSTACCLMSRLPTPGNPAGQTQQGRLPIPLCQREFYKPQPPSPLVTCPSGRWWLELRCVDLPQLAYSLPRRGTRGEPLRTSTDAHVGWCGHRFQNSGQYLGAELLGPEGNACSPSWEHPGHFPKWPATAHLPSLVTQHPQQHLLLGGALFCFNFRHSNMCVVGWDLTVAVLICKSSRTNEPDCLFTSYHLIFIFISYNSL